VNEAPQGQRSDQPQNIATAITEVSERATLLVREEIELAKAEVTEKVTKLARGAIVAGAAGVFVVTALVFVLNGLAWLLYYVLPIGGTFTYFWGFFAMALILLVLGALAGFLAARLVRRSAPPMPDMAIAEARKIRETVSAGASGAGVSAGAAASGGGAGAAAGADGRGGAGATAFPS
jgi:uncharacterized membrane protein YgcG